MKNHSLSLFASLAVLVSNVTSQQIDWFQSPINGKWYGVTNATSTWTEGEVVAVALGGHLATVRSAAEQAWVQTTFAGYLTGEGLWIGTNDVAVEGQWVWASGEVPSFTHWAPGEPSNAGGVEDWGHLQGTNYGSGTWRWNDSNNVASLRPLIEVTTRPTPAWAWPRTFNTDSGPYFGHAVDIDGDEDLDYISPNNSSNTITVYANNGSGVFSFVQQISGVGAVRTVRGADVDGDGFVDILAATASGLMLMLQNGVGQFGSPTWAFNTGSYAHGLEVADLNADGRMDAVLTCTYWDYRAYILLGQPNGTFSNPSSFYCPSYGVSDAYQPTLTDLDGDQILDLVVAGESSGILLFRGIGSGAFTFQQSLAAATCYKATAFDADGDGDIDLVVPLFNQASVQHWRNQGNWSFQLASTIACGSGPIWSTAADFDGDADPDLVIAELYSNTIRTLRNDGTGTFSLESILANQNYPNWVSCADLDGDASPDILCSNRNANNVSIHFNQAAFASIPSAPVVWTNNTALQPPFPARHSPAVAVRPTELLYFGGYDTAARNETWSFDGTSWVKLYSLANPAARYDHGMVHDAARALTVLFGGRSAVFPTMPDTWVWDGIEWTRRFPVTSPPGRYGHAMVYDASLQLVVLFGGRNATTVFNDTWTWNGVTWSQALTAGPSARFDHAMAYDAFRQRVVLVGGETATGLIGELWERSGTTWTQRNDVTGGPGAVAGAACTWDNPARRVVIHGGRIATGATGATYVYEGTRWLRLRANGNGPARRSGHVIARLTGQTGLHMLGGSASGPLYGDLWQTTLPPFGSFTSFGAGCLGSGGLPSLVAVTDPALGTGFTVRVQNPPVGMPVGVGLMGQSNTAWSVFPLPLSLGFFGMPGCTLYVEPLILKNFIPVGGVAQWSETLANNAALLGQSFYLQVLLIDPAVPNPNSTFPGVVTNALTATIGY